MPIGPLGASLIGGAIGLVGGERRNRVDQREARKARDFQSVEADKNRSFQERMRNSAWQAGVADMRAAGINPALAYGQGPAASPGGSMAGGAQASGALDTASSAMSMAQNQEALRMMKANTRKAQSEADIAGAQEREQRFSTNWRLGKGPGQARYPMFDILEAERDSAKHGASNLRALASRNTQLGNIAGLAGVPAGAVNRISSWLLNEGGQASSKWFQEFGRSQRSKANPLFRRPR